MSVTVWLTMMSALPIIERSLHETRMDFKYSITKGLTTSASNQTTAQCSTDKTTVKTTTTVKSVAPAMLIKETTPKKMAASSSSSYYSGDGTYYDVGLGSCGFENINSQMVAALNAPQMQNRENPNKNPLCGKAIKVTNPANNKSVVVKIVSML